MSTNQGDVLLGRYRILRELGSGGMGAVYLAEHVHLGRLTAVKLLKPELTSIPDAEARFRREALLAARINHPAVAQVYDFDRTPDGEFLLAMEYVEGETVAKRLRREGPFPVPMAIRLLEAIAEGLDRAHALGILHRDIKPENVMLGANGAAKLLDFGVARPLNGTSGATSPGFVVGTPAYMSPEQLAGEALGPPSDLYQLGLVMYEVLSGQLPHDSPTIEELKMRRLSVPAPPLHLLRRDVPPELALAIARALEPDPSARWPGAVAFARAAAGNTHPHAPSGPTDPGDGALDRWAAHAEALRFAGREQEIRLVRDAWAAARAGRGLILWIEGDEGAGKSSFVELARREAANDGAARLMGRGYEADLVRPYGAWMSVMRNALQLQAAQGKTWPSISALIQAAPETPSRTALYEEVARLIREAAGRGPLMLGIEDLEWCDPASLSLLEFAWHELADVPLLIAVSAVTGAARGQATVRDVRERLRRLDHVVWVTLRPLTQEAVSAWLTRALGRPLPDALCRHVYGHTEGNAFFIEQVVRSLVERGDLDRASRDTASYALTELAPPEAVAEVVRRRLDVMAPAARDILQIAAVVGREFDVDLLVAVSGMEEEVLLDALDEAVAAAVLEPSARASGDWYRFTHNKLGEVLAHGLNQRRRRRLHARIAEELEKRPDAPGVRAWHWYRAGERPRACDAARAAARHALAIHDYEDALSFATMAAETADDPEAQREAGLLRAAAQTRLGAKEEA